MKTLLTIILSLVLFNCGGDNPSIPDFCDSDRDCEEEFFCISGECVFQPECETDEDCPEPNEICNSEYQCVSFWDADTCLGELCYGDCEECGPYTSCYLGDCANACDVHIIKYRIYLQHVCESYSGCLYCECKLQGRAVVDGECGYINDPNCETAAEGLVGSLKSDVLIPERWEVVTEQIDKNVRLNCSQN